jgi:hypothetical protein
VMEEQKQNTIKANEKRDDSDELFFWWLVVGAWPAPAYQVQEAGQTKARGQKIFNSESQMKQDGTT